MHTPKQQEEPPTRAVRRAHELLNVAVDAKAPELTRAYWRQARQLHPDLSADPQATEQFRALHAAYQLALRAASPTPPSTPSTWRGPESPATADSAFPASQVVVVGSAARMDPSGWSTAGNAATTADDGVWVVAGPVHIRGASWPGPARERQEGRP